jgi:hypothetical protein
MVVVRRNGGCSRRSRRASTSASLGIPGSAGEVAGARRCCMPAQECRGARCAGRAEAHGLVGIEDLAWHSRLFAGPCVCGKVRRSSRAAVALNTAARYNMSVDTDALRRPRAVARSFASRRSPLRYVVKMEVLDAPSLQASTSRDAAHSVLLEPGCTSRRRVPGKEIPVAGHDLARRGAFSPAGVLEGAEASRSDNGRSQHNTAVDTDALRRPRAAARSFASRRSPLR